MNNAPRIYRSRKAGGFTLVEILIVVIILGILAAIVIPQFTNASTSARENSLTSQLQTIRSQIELYKLQHNDTLPDLVTSWDQLTKKTNAAGTTNAADGSLDFGPYMQAAPTNPLSPGSLSTVTDGTGAAAAAAATGFVYDYNSGAGTGKIFGTGTDGKTIWAN